ncbi:hypothetical protein BCR34DRAFT_577086 [Clohesyomyces aquaticus]|uniref:Uncharacterized protein n=1 Tax=Clohesyomyces aquaticus TaxID=1231657 RepID=A0A1Y1YKU1_9PLEO|nr:hypothetical protein BCR34DRAFT_577086 [Clohesyomyces aquaticus]
MSNMMHVERLSRPSNQSSPQSVLEEPACSRKPMLDHFHPDVLFDTPGLATQFCPNPTSSAVTWVEGARGVRAFGRGCGPASTN